MYLVNAISLILVGLAAMGFGLFLFYALLPLFYAFFGVGSLPLPRPLSGVERTKSARKQTSASECRLLGDKRTYWRHGLDFRL